MNAFIDNRGYVIHKNSIDEKQQETIKKDLCIRPMTHGNFGKGRDKSFPIYREDEKYLVVPKYYGLTYLGAVTENKLNDCNYPTHDMKYTGCLRPAQKEIVDKVISGFEKERGGLLIAGCGIGKTNMAIYLACHYGLKTLFVVHKKFLKDQADQRIKTVSNIQKVGLIQRKKIDTDSPFVIGMIHSLAMIDYDRKIFQDFGLIIIDEVHHMGSKVFSRFFQKISAKYMLGISAENRRNDGAFMLIQWFMGPILHFEEQRQNSQVIVKKFHYRTSCQKRIREIYNKYNGEPERPKMITNLVHIKKRNRFILFLIEILYKSGKNILCLSGRIKHIDLLYKLLERKGYGDQIGKYIGRLSENELLSSSSKKIILGSFNMAEEGLDIPDLNVVIFCTPKSSIKQSVGRILRKESEGHSPLVIDIIDMDNHIFKNQAKRRNMYYQKQGYRSQEYDIKDYAKTKGALYNDLPYLEKCLTEIPRVNVTSRVPADLSQIIFLDD